MNPLVSIIIPTYNHAVYLPDAVRSALAQSLADLEVIVVDDGSTDDTLRVLQAFLEDPRVRLLSLPHGGPSLARNAGLEDARGQFVMLLDADDVIAPTKLAEQLAELARSPEAGWCLCDVRIEDEAKGRSVLASEQYGYDRKALAGWIAPLLRDRNFIPIMSPLIRRSVLGEGIRFDDRRVPEDWHFWVAVAEAARVRYVPRELATYRHRRTGRSRLPKQARMVRPNYTAPLRLNLGCGREGTRSWHPMDQLVNLDKSLGWRFEEGLGDFVDGSVAGVTISHALMYVAEADWPFVCREIARVLEPGGVVRITEDETIDPRSSRVGGWRGSEPAVTLTSPAFVMGHLERAGLRPYRVDKFTTRYRDRSLCQAQHGEEPHVFFVEGVKLASVFLSPHNDDETLFGAFTLMRYRPRVVVAFASSGDYGSAETREAETRDALAVLGAGPLEQWNLPSGVDRVEAVVERLAALKQAMRTEHVWAPSIQSSHVDHRVLARAAGIVFGDLVTRYHTYDSAGKVRRGLEVEAELGWAQHKLRALARYTSQIQHPRAQQFFFEDLREFKEAP
jgi:glycosyltransferase involved in cell wall biosynthesis/LmbE family N-acetylglucosaminyl deacetylase